jgi:hypothetical protein
VPILRKSPVGDIHPGENFYSTKDVKSLRRWNLNNVLKCTINSKANSSSLFGWIKVDICRSMCKASLQNDVNERRWLDNAE